MLNVSKVAVSSDILPELEVYYLQSTTIDAFTIASILITAAERLLHACNATSVAPSVCTYHIATTSFTCNYN